ncbi:MAG TPA: AraC family transcriptional regulator [Cellulomonas sp.]
MPRTDDRELPVYAAGSVEVPYVIRGMLEPLDRDTRWGLHSHPTHELLWNERGVSTATVGTRTWSITPRHGLWIPAGTLHTGSAPAGTWYRTAQFGPHAVPSIADAPVAVEVTPLLRLLLERLDDPVLAPGSRSVTETMVLDVLAPAPHELLVQVPEAPLLGRVVAAVLADPGDRRTLGAWAAELGVSPRTLTRAFRQETGHGFTGWVASVRANRAMGLLMEGAEPGDVAAATGYASVSAFGAAFRRVTGLTPGAVRDRPAPPTTTRTDG